MHDRFDTGVCVRVCVQVKKCLFHFLWFFFFNQSINQSLKYIRERWRWRTDYLYTTNKTFGRKFFLLHLLESSSPSLTSLPHNKEQIATVSLSEETNLSIDTFNLAKPFVNLYLHYERYYTRSGSHLLRNYFLLPRSSLRFRVNVFIYSSSFALSAHAHAHHLTLLIRLHYS